MWVYFAILSIIVFQIILLWRLSEKLKRISLRLNALKSELMRATNLHE